MKELTAQEVLRNTFDHFEKVIGKEEEKARQRPRPSGAAEAEDGAAADNSAKEAVVEGSGE